MKLVQDPTKSIYAPYQGTFRTFDLNESWNFCRVTFHNHHQKHIAAGGGDAFMYKCSNSQTTEMLIDVVEKIQKRLKLHENQKLVFGLLKSDRDVLYIETGKWWKNPVRFNLLTAFIKDTIRCDRLDYVIKDGYLYLERTKEAIYKFLDGNVHYGGPFFEGWVDDFQRGRNLELLQKKPSKHNPMQVRFYDSWATHDVYIDED